MGRERALTDGVWFEDYAVGDIFRCDRPVAFTEASIVAFARLYDPQPHHLDRAAAEAGLFGGLTASGFHLISEVWGALVGAGFLQGRALGGIGLDDLRIFKPVRPGDRLSAAATVVETRPSATRSDRGYVTLRIDVFDGADAPVAVFTMPQIIARRQAGE